MPIFRCPWCRTRSVHPQAGVLAVCPECGAKFNTIDWKAKGRDMTHQFATGDIVRLNGTDEHCKVTGFSSKDHSLLLVAAASFEAEFYVPVHSVTLVRPSGVAQASHPSKLET